MLKLLVMSMMFSAHAACPSSLIDCVSNEGEAGENCLRIDDQSGHLELTSNFLEGVEYVQTFHQITSASIWRFNHVFGAIGEDDLSFTAFDSNDNEISINNIAIDSTNFTQLYFDSPQIGYVMIRVYVTTPPPTTTGSDLQFVVGAGAFSQCTSLTSVDMPKVTKIDNNAFMGTSLTSVDMPKVTDIGRYAFKWFLRDTLTSVFMPEVKKIGYGAFDGTSLTTVDMPLVVEIGPFAFSGTSLTTVDMPKVTDIGERAFSGTSLKTVSMPLVQTIGVSAFSGTLTSVYTNEQIKTNYVFNDAVVTIRSGCPTDCIDEATENCVRSGHLEITDDTLADVSYDDGSLVVGPYAFTNCTLTSVSMPSVTKIGAMAFKDTSLTWVSMPAITTIESLSFQGSSLTSVSMPNVTEIQANAFVGTGLTSVSMPSVTKIGADAFKGTSLTSVSMPLVTDIGANAFQDTSLTWVSMPTVHFMHFNKSLAFDGCSSLVLVADSTKISTLPPAEYNNALKSYYSSIGC